MHHNRQTKYVNCDYLLNNTKIPSYTQCCAVTGNNKRCENITINNSNHCAIHYPVAKKLYNKYKKICETAYKMDVDHVNNIKDKNNQIRHIMKCYVWLNKAFNARLAHRKYAFVPECYDNGHDMQFLLIRNKINKCEQFLSTVYRNCVVTPENNNIDELADTKVLGDELNNKKNYGMNNKKNYGKKYRADVDNVSKKIIKYNRSRIITEENFAKYLDIYNKENEMILSRRLKLNKLVVNLLISFFDNKYIDDGTFDILILCVVMYYLVSGLKTISYYDKDYTFPGCDDCCEGCISEFTYNIQLNCDNHVGNHLSVDSYLNSMNEKCLKEFYLLMLLNGNKIKPIISDFVKFYRMYGKDVVNMKTMLIWDSDKNRYKMNINSNREQIKIHQIMRLNRLRQYSLHQKYINSQKYKKNICEFDSDSAENSEDYSEYNSQEEEYQEEDQEECDCYLCRGISVCNCSDEDCDGDCEVSQNNE